MNNRSVIYVARSSSWFITFFCAIIIFVACTDFARSEKLALFEGIKIVTEENRLIKIKQQEESISEADTLIARSGLLPRADAKYNQVYTEMQPGVVIGSQSAPTAERSFYTYSLAIQQLLYDFGGVSSYYEANKSVYETKRLDTKRTKNYVAFQFALSYYDLLEAEKMVAVAAEEKERLDLHLANAKSLYDEGVITKNDLLQAEIKLSDARQKLLTAQNLKSIRHSQLNNLLARSLSTKIETEETNIVFANDVDLDKAQESAEKDRYEMKIIDTTLQAIKSEESAKKSEYLPMFFLQGRYDYTKNKYQIHEGLLSVMIGMNINLLNGGSTKAGLSKIASQKQRLIVERKKLIDDIKLDVERYYLEMMSAQEKVRVTKGAITQAEENLRINKVKYGDGVGTATDVIDAITLLTVAETNYYKSLYEYNRAYAGLMHATGKDLLEVYK
jgi:outer membrane protein